MANTAQARKRARQAETHRIRNASDRSLMRTHIKRVVKAISSGDKAKAEEAYKAAIPMIDHMAGKGIVHKNKAARHKSRMNKHIRAMS